MDDTEKRNSIDTQWVKAVKREAVIAHIVEWGAEVIQSAGVRGVDMLAEMFFQHLSRDLDAPSAADEIYAVYQKTWGGQWRNDGL